MRLSSFARIEFRITFTFFTITMKARWALTTFYFEVLQIDREFSKLRAISGRWRNEKFLGVLPNVPINPQSKIRIYICTRL